MPAYLERLTHRLAGFIAVAGSAAAALLFLVHRSQAVQTDDSGIGVPQWLTALVLVVISVLSVEVCRAHVGGLERTQQPHKALSARMAPCPAQWATAREVGGRVVAPGHPGQLAFTSLDAAIAVFAVSAVSASHRRQGSRPAFRPLARSRPRLLSKSWRPRCWRAVATSRRSTLYLILRLR